LVTVGACSLIVNEMNRVTRQADFHLSIVLLEKYGSQ
jgi:hypothetical protein